MSKVVIYIIVSFYICFVVLPEMWATSRASVDDYVYASSSVVQGDSAIPHPPKRNRNTKRRMRKLQSSARIAWGSEATNGQFDFMAYIAGNNFMCSGSLISPRVVLTAAHCVRNVDPSSVYVYVGDVNVEYADYYYAEQFYVNENYNTNTQFGDIALILLTDPVSSKIQPVALASDVSILNGVSEVTIAGFGQIQSGSLPGKLYYSTEPVVSANQCTAQNSNLIGGRVPRDHICFGLGTNPPSSTCPGDSGGPFLVMQNGQPPVQVALTSYGPASYKCGDKNGNLDVPTSVPYWYQWIQDTISVHNMAGARQAVRQNTFKKNVCLQSGSNPFIVQSQSVGGCCESCRNNSTCTAWSWTKASSSCTLFSSNDAPHETKSKTCESGYFN